LPHLIKSPKTNESEKFLIKEKEISFLIFLKIKKEEKKTNPQIFKNEKFLKLIQGQYND
jgi:hypothetical protein